MYLKNREADDVNSSLRAVEEEMRCHSSNSKAEKKSQISASSAFCPTQALNGLGDVHSCWREQSNSNLLSADSNANLIWQHLLDVPRNNV